MLLSSAEKILGSFAPFASSDEPFQLTVFKTFYLQNQQLVNLALCALFVPS